MIIQSFFVLKYNGFPVISKYGRNNLFTYSKLPQSFEKNLILPIHLSVYRSMASSSKFPIPYYFKSMFTPLQTLSMSSSSISSISSSTSVSMSMSMPIKSRVSSNSNIFKVEYSYADVYIVPMFSDNYGYIIIDKSTGKVATVDPGEPVAIINALNSIQNQGLSSDRDLKLDYILCTHKHDDHIGGNIKLKQTYSSAKIIGTQYEPIPGIEERVGEGSIFQMGDISVQVMYTPCHTKGHIAFLMKGKDSNGNNSSPDILFPGDTLFVGGCGRFFEGTAEDMLQNMDRFRQLDPNTSIYCAHEYTESNYRFLISISHPLCGDRYDEVRRMRGTLKDDHNKLPEPTVPSTIESEMKSNLFMRCRDPMVQKLLKIDNDPVQTIATLRKMKNSFK